MKSNGNSSIRNRRSSSVAVGREDSSHSPTSRRDSSVVVGDLSQTSASSFEDLDGSGTSIVPPLPDITNKYEYEDTGRNHQYRRRSSTTIRASLRISEIRRKSSLFLRESGVEMMTLMKNQVSATHLMNQEVKRIIQNRTLIFPEAPTKWDTFWVGLIVLFILTVLPGFYHYYTQSYLYEGPYWQPTGQSLFFQDVNTLMALYQTPHFGITTPLQISMPNHFVTHVLFGTVASILLIFLFTTGRVMRWRLADGTVDHDSAESLHKLSAFWSSICWIIIIVTGTKAIPLLHPTLQIFNCAESFGVTTLFVGTLVSAYLRQWVLHRLCTWGLIYSATASVFLLVNGRLLQAYSGLPCFQIKAINYVLAFSIPIVGLLRDIWYEFSKSYQAEGNEARIRRMAESRNQRLEPARMSQYRCTPFQGVRGDNKRRLSFWQYVVQAEPEEEYISRRSSSVFVTNRPSAVRSNTMSVIAQLQSQLDLNELYNADDDD